MREDLTDDNPSGAPPDIVRSGESSPVRGQAWLDDLLNLTWADYFSDVPRQNEVRIIFGKRARRQLGSIKFDRNDRETTIITMNGLFRSPEIPEFVVLATLVHEMVHYAHGFSSPLAQQHTHPHAGGVVRAEYAERGLEGLYDRQKQWLKVHWPTIVRENLAPPKRRRARRARISIAKPFWF